MKGRDPAVIPAGTLIHVAYRYNPAPDQLSVQRFINNQPVGITLEKNSFHAPTTKGIYYYTVGANWIKQGTSYSLGDTSAAFAIEIR